MTAYSETRLSLRSWVSIAAASVRLGVGFALFRATGKTPAFAYQSLIRLFTLTSGRSNDFLASLISWFRRPYPISVVEGVLGIRSREDLERIAAQIVDRGYFVFDQQLPTDMCDRLMRFALTQPCRARATDAQSPDSDQKAVPYPRENPAAIIYDFPPTDVIVDPDVQSLMTDPSINALAERYLGAKPVLDMINMWWSTALSQRPDNNAAQLYHFDMDHIRWLKFFIYVTDMTPRAGPHCFVAGSHRSGAIPATFLSRGYVRLSDAEVNQHFSPSDVKEFVGGRGTIVVEDTRGLHKGKPVIAGDRLMLEFEFSNSLFGANFKSGDQPVKMHDPTSNAFVERYPRIFRRWLGSMPQR